MPRSDAVQIGYDSFKVPARNGNAFSEGNIVRFNLERNMGMADLANSYLEMEVELVHPTNNTDALKNTMPMVSLESDIGASSLIEEMHIRSEGRPIESLRHYAEFAKIHYNATKSEAIMNKRCRLEGCAKSYMPQDNSFFTNNQPIASVAAANSAVNGITIATNNFGKAIRRKVCLPLLGGIFTSPRSFPLMGMPLEVELIMAQHLRVIRVCNIGDGRTSVRVADQAAGLAGVELSTVYIQDRAQFNTPGSNSAAGITPNSVTALTEGEEQLNQLNNCWFRPGQVVRILAPAGSDIQANNGDYAGGGINRTIQSIKVIDQLNNVNVNFLGMIAITFTTPITGAAGGAGSTGITIDTVDATTAGLPLTVVGGGADINQGQFGYQVFNPRLVIQKVIPPPQVMSQMASAISRGGMNMDIVSWTAIDNAVPAGQTNTTNILPIDLSRVKSIMSVPTNTNVQDSVLNSNAIQGANLNAFQYQYQVDGKLIPDRVVDMRVERFPVVLTPLNDETLKPYRIGSFVSGFHRYEAEKALRSANIDYTNTNFLTNNPSTLNTITNNYNQTEPGSWFVGRSFGAGVGSSKNLVGKSVLLYLNYNTANNTVGKLIKNFVVHIRTISLDMNGVSVFY